MGTRWGQVTRETDGDRLQGGPETDGDRLQETDGDRLQTDGDRLQTDGDRLHIRFDLIAPERLKLLTLRQEETKHAWTVLLNGQKLGALPRDHHHLEHGIAVPPGLLKAAGNVLEISRNGIGTILS